MRGQRIKDRLDWNLMDSPASAAVMLIIMMLVAAFVTGCAAPIEGKVVGKDVDPGRTETYWTTDRYGCGIERYTTTETVNGKTKTTQKTRQKWCDRRIQKTRDVPPSWDLNILKDDGKLQWVEVSESAFRRIQIGERVNTGNLR